MKISLSKCVCKFPMITKSIEGICGACFGRISDNKQSRAHTPTLNPFQDTTNEFNSKKNSPNPFKKQPKIVKTSSNLECYQSIHHKRSNTSNKPEENPKNFNIFNQIHYHSDSQPTMKSLFYANKPLTERQVSKDLQQIVEFDNFNDVFVKKHERALSSRVHKINFNQYFMEKVRCGDDGLRENYFVPCEYLHEGHRNSVNCVSFIMNKAFSAGSDYNIVAWPRLGNKHQFKSSIITYKPTTSSNPNEIFQKTILKPLNTYRGHSHKIQALESFSNSLLISSGQEQNLRIWNTSQNFKPIQSINSNENSTKCLQSISDQQLLSGSASGNIKLWDINNKFLIKSYTKHNSPVLSLTSITNNTFLSGNQNGTVHLYDTRIPHEISNFSHSAPVTSLTTSDELYFYSASDQLWVFNN